MNHQKHRGQKQHTFMNCPFSWVGVWAQHGSLPSISPSPKQKPWKAFPAPSWNCKGQSVCRVIQSVDDIQLRMMVGLKVWLSCSSLAGGQPQLLESSIPWLVTFFSAKKRTWRISTSLWCPWPWPFPAPCFTFCPTHLRNTLLLSGTYLILLGCLDCPGQPLCFKFI